MALPTASDNEFPKVILEEVANDGSATVTPAADHRALFVGEDGALHLKDSSGTVTAVDSGAVAPWLIVADAGAVPVAQLAFSVANLGLAAPVTIPASVEITGIYIRVANQSGNISVGLYSEALSRVATSGAVACPAASGAHQLISFTGAYTAAAGRYWLAMSCDNTTATFDMANVSGTGLIGTKQMTTAHPLPATFTPTGSFNRCPVMGGKVTGGWAV